MLRWNSVRALVIRYTGLALALWGLPFGVAAAKIALTRPDGAASDLAITMLGLLPAAGMLFVGLLGVAMVAYSAGWLRPRR